MNIEDIGIFIFILIISLVAFIISYFQFKEKGFLFNNSYIYASKQERKTMNKKPYYRQSAIVFLLIGFAFLILAVATISTFKWPYIAFILIIIFIIIYAIISSINIEKKIHKD